MKNNKVLVNTGLKSSSVMTHKNDKPKITKEELKKKMRKDRERDRELVTGKFHNREASKSKGTCGVVNFSIKLYPGDEVETYELYDGEVYTIPRGVARHLNNNCFYTEYAHLANESGAAGLRAGVTQGTADNGRSSQRLSIEGAQAMQVARKIHRYEFNSMDFMDDEDMYPTDLVEVTAAV